MDTAANNNEVRLRKGASRNERLVSAGFALFVCLFALPGLVAWVGNGQWPDIGTILALLVGCLLLGNAALSRNIVWVITPGGILIGEQRPFGQLHSRRIRSDEIAEVHVRKDSALTEFSLAFRTGSGDMLISPVVPDVTQVHDTTIRIARLLKLPDPGPVDNPLDAINPEIRLGNPVESKAGERRRIFIVILACVLSFPFVHALWNGELSGLWIAVWSLGLIVAVVTFRFAHRMSGTFWIIRDGEILVERRSLDGAAEAATIVGADVDSINVESRGEGESDQHILTIKLHGGRKIRSPKLASKNHAQALRGEIVRRLNISARMPVA